MQIEPVLLEQGTPLPRTPGLILIANTPKGRGIFASQFIPAKTVIDVCPVLIFSDDETTNHISKTCLDHYTYYWPSPSGRSLQQALCLGLGSMFNHSTLHQNVVWTRDLEAECITYSAYRDIQLGEELCISYGSGRLWFEDAEAREANGEDGDGVLEHDPGQTLGELELGGLSRIEVDLD